MPRISQAVSVEQVWGGPQIDTTDIKYILKTFHKEKSNFRSIEERKTFHFSTFLVRGYFGPRNWAQPVNLMKPRELLLVFDWTLVLHLILNSLIPARFGLMQLLQLAIAFLVLLYS